MGILSIFAKVNKMNKEIEQNKDKYKDDLFTVIITSSLNDRKKRRAASIVKTWLGGSNSDIKELMNGSVPIEVRKHLSYEKAYKAVFNLKDEDIDAELVNETPDGSSAVATSGELSNQTKLDNEIKTQTEENASQEDSKSANKKHRYAIRLDGEMITVQSIKLPNATEERLEEMWDNDDSFVYFVDSIEFLYSTTEDILCPDEYEDEEDEEAKAFKELIGDQTEEDVRCSNYYLNFENNYTISLHELTDDDEYQEINGDLNLETLLQIDHMENIQQHINERGLEEDLKKFQQFIADHGLEDNLTTLQQLINNHTLDLDDELVDCYKLKELYKKNGLDESSNLAFFDDEKMKFDPDQWYLVNTQYSDDSTMEYIFETDEEFDERKLSVVYSQIQWDELNCFITGLFYDGKLLTPNDCCDGSSYARNCIVRFKEDQDDGMTISNIFPKN